MKPKLFFLLLILPLLVSAQIPAQLAIAGKAKTETIPDITIIDINLTASDMSYSQAMAQLQAQTDAMKSFLKKQKLTDEQWKSENFSINKTFAYESRKPVFKGYLASVIIRLEFKNNLEQANTIINALGESNSEAEVNINHRISQELQAKVNDQLLIAAIEDAKHKAKIIADNTDKQLINIVKINYGVEENISVSPHIESSFMAANKRAGASHSLQLKPTPVTSSTEIIVHWLMQNKQ